MGVGSRTVRRVLKWVGVAIGVFVVAVAALVGYANWQASQGVDVRDARAYVLRYLDTNEKPSNREPRRMDCRLVMETNPDQFLCDERDLK
jgi:hypothetical protein